MNRNSYTETLYTSFQPGPWFAVHQHSPTTSFSIILVQSLENDPVEPRIVHLFDRVIYVISLPPCYLHRLALSSSSLPRFMYITLCSITCSSERSANIVCAGIVSLGDKVGMKDFISTQP